MAYVKSSSAGTPSVYSHVTTRSSANLRSSRSRSVKSLKTPWYRKPLVQETFFSFLDVQRASMLIAVFSLVCFCNQNCIKIITGDLISVSFNFYDNHSMFRSVLLLNGNSGIYTLWILCNIL